jgi:hypothetical protein
VHFLAQVVNPSGAGMGEIVRLARAAAGWTAQDGEAMVTQA